MHMADALLSPAVGGAMWAATATTTVCSARRVRREMDDAHVPLMGVLGAFIFAAQMINFTIPGTGSSGHLGGGMILAILLGPHAAFLTVASVLAVQALFFADGGLLALGANIFNMGFIPCFVAYPLVYRSVAGRSSSPGRVTAASVLSAVAALQLGAFGVVAETVLSGVSQLPFRSFVLLMQPIHLAIGIVEGLVTAAVVTFVVRVQPEVLDLAPETSGRPERGLRTLLWSMAAAALLLGGGLSWFASRHPDGLEWALERVRGGGEPAPTGQVHGALEKLQEKTAVLPDYGFKGAGGGDASDERAPSSWPAVEPGTSVSGIVGGLITLLLAFGAGWALRRRKRSGG